MRTGIVIEIESGRGTIVMIGLDHHNNRLSLLPCRKLDRYLDLLDLRHRSRDRQEVELELESEVVHQSRPVRGLRSIRLI
jgi:hypothetical protein